jgi:hypothetical protein
MHRAKLVLLHTLQPAWHGTQLPALSTVPATHTEQTAEPLVTMQEAQFTPQLLLPLVLFWHVLLARRVHPTGQDVHIVALEALQVAQGHVQSMQVLFVVIVLPGKQLMHWAGVEVEHCLQLLVDVQGAQIPAVALM